MHIDTKNLTIKKAREHLLAGDFTATELFDAYKKNISEKNPELNAYLGDTFSAPENIDELGRNPDLPLGGIPLAMKDNILITGEIGSASSNILGNYAATYDATVTKLLRENGAVILGRVNMDEFAMGSSTENSAYGRSKNPLDTSRVPGGSSGGSAVAVAGDMALASLGSDTGGSIRQPASFCGLVGLYPTYDTVSRYGLIALASSLDQIGPITKTVADAEIIWKAIAQFDPMDAQSVSTERRIASTKKPKVIGIPKEIADIPGVDPDVRKNFEQSVEKLKQAGYEIKEISLPNLKYGLAVYYIIMPAEASTNLGRLDGVRFGKREGDGDLPAQAGLLSLYEKSRGLGFGTEVKRRIMLGTFALSSGYYDAYYGKATAVRNMIRDDYKKAFETVDAIITPTTPTGAFKSGEKSDPLAMYAADIFTVPANLAGVPAISIPSGKDANNMPLGLHITAPWFSEETLFTIGKEFEKLNGDR